MEEVLKCTRELCSADLMHQDTRQWIQNRRKLLDEVHAVVAIFQVFQEDLLEIAVGTDMERVVREIERDTLQGDLQVKLSAKPKATKELDTRFEFIGAEFDTFNIEDIRRKPVEHILEKLRAQVPQLLDRAPALMELTRAEELIGLLAFCARFIPHGRVRLNPTYSCLASTEHLQVLRKQVMISKEMAEDVGTMLDDIKHDHCAPITISSTFHSIRTHGASSDASGSTAKSWGAHAFGAYAHGTWAPRTRRLMEGGKYQLTSWN